MLANYNSQNRIIKINFAFNLTTMLILLLRLYFRLRIVSNPILERLQLAGRKRDTKINQSRVTW